MKKDKKKACSAHPGKDIPVKHRLIKLFWVLAPAFTRWAESHMYKEGLTAQRMRLMELLLENGPMKMSSLGDELGVTATNVTALVDALEKDAMVIRKPHKNDRRAIMIELTSKAEIRLNERCARIKDKVGELFSSFDKKELEHFVELLLRTREALVDRRVLEPSDHCPKSATAKRKAGDA